MKLLLLLIVVFLLTGCTDDASFRLSTDDNLKGITRDYMVSEDDRQNISKELNISDSYIYFQKEEYVFSKSRDIFGIVFGVKNPFNKSTTYLLTIVPNSSSYSGLEFVYHKNKITSYPNSIQTHDVMITNNNVTTGSYYYKFIADFGSESIEKQILIKII